MTRRAASSSPLNFALTIFPHVGGYCWLNTNAGSQGVRFVMLRSPAPSDGLPSMRAPAAEADLYADRPLLTLVRTRCAEVHSLLYSCFCESAEHKHLVTTPVTASHRAV